MKTQKTTVTTGLAAATQELFLQQYSPNQTWYLSGTSGWLFRLGYDFKDEIKTIKVIMSYGGFSGYSSFDATGILIGELDVLGEGVYHLSDEKFEEYLQNLRESKLQRDERILEHWKSLQIASEVRFNILVEHVNCVLKSIGWQLTSFPDIIPKDFGSALFVGTKTDEQGLILTSAFEMLANQWVERFIPEHVVMKSLLGIHDPREDPTEVVFTIMPL